MGASAVIGPAAVRRVAAETGYREEAVEKVLYLTAILGRLRTHPDLRNAWVLKGGTAINLFHLDVPRFSVDIDINYVGHAELKAMQAARPGFEPEFLRSCRGANGATTTTASAWKISPKRLPVRRRTQTGPRNPAN